MLTHMLYKMTEIAPILFYFTSCSQFYFILFLFLNSLVFFFFITKGKAEREREREREFLCLMEGRIIVTLFLIIGSKQLKRDLLLSSIVLLPIKLIHV
jgi:hypothetical protein